jgi:hypothetical protein
VLGLCAPLGAPAAAVLGPALSSCSLLIAPPLACWCLEYQDRITERLLLKQVAEIHLVRPHDVQAGPACLASRTTDVVQGSVRGRELFERTHCVQGVHD